MTSFFWVVIGTPGTQTGVILKCLFDRKREAVIICPHTAAHHLGVCTPYIGQIQAVKAYGITVTMLARGGRALIKMLGINAVTMLARMSYSIRSIAVYLDIDISYQGDDGSVAAQFMK